MEKQILVVCGIVLLMFCVDVARCQDCSTTALQNRQRQCYASAGIDIGSGTDPTKLENLVSNNASTVCRLTESLKTAIRCIVADGRRCMVSLGADPNLIASADQMIDGISYLCNNSQSINANCVTSSTSSLTNCVTNKAQNAGLTQDDARDTKKIICLAYDWSLECFQGSGLPTCDAKTKEVMVGYTRIIRPPACGGGGGGVGGGVVSGGVGGGGGSGGASFLGVSSAVLLLGYLLSAVFSK